MVYAIDLANPTVNPLQRFGTISSLLNLIIPLLTVGGALIFLVMMIYGAIMWLQSEGKPEALQKAQNTFVMAAIGLLIVVSAIVITKLIGRVLNVPIPI